MTPPAQTITLITNSKKIFFFWCLHTGATTVFYERVPIFTIHRCFMLLVENKFVFFRLLSVIVWTELIEWKKRQKAHIIALRHSVCWTRRSNNTRVYVVYVQMCVYMCSTSDSINTRKQQKQKPTQKLLSFRIVE